MAALTGAHTLVGALVTSEGWSWGAADGSTARVAVPRDGGASTSLERICLQFRGEVGDQRKRIPQPALLLTKLGKVRATAQPDVPQRVVCLDAVT